MEVETATLILNTYDIHLSYFTNVNVDNIYGTITNNRCTFQWKNINMRRVLGEMYDKYETFNIYLYQISQGGSNGTATTAQFALCDIRISGLPFINNSYTIASKNNTNSSFLTSYVLNIQNNNQAGLITPMYNPPILTFGKSSDNVNITLDIKCTKDQQYPTIANPAGTSLGHFVFIFKFYGIPTRDPNIIINGSTM